MTITNKSIILLIHQGKMNKEVVHMKKITPTKLREKLNHKKMTILDVRSKEKFQMGRLKHENAENIHVHKDDIFALEETDEDVKLPFSKETEVIVTCTTGNSATRCTKILEEKGYNVTLLEGGMVAWNQEHPSAQ